jgi:hypothetical protein
LSGASGKHRVRNAEANRISSPPGVSTNETRQDVEQNEGGERETR